MTEFPIILMRETLASAVYEPISVLVHYVNGLLTLGVHDTQMPRYLIDLYALDYYQGQVRNGGHSQFIGNSGNTLSQNMQHALRGATLLKLDAVTQILTECRDWCDAHPDECEQQNGFSERAAPLELLDSRLYAVEYDDAGYAGFVAAQPEHVQDWIKTATNASDFYARSQYHLAAAAWLLTQPNTRILPHEEAVAAMRKIANDQLSQSSPAPETLWKRMTRFLR